MISNIGFLNSGHETDAFVVYSRQFGHDIIMKVHRFDSDDWHSRQIFAKNKISNALLSLSNRPYRIPKVFGIYKNHMYEELMPGERVGALWKGLVKSDKEKILYAAACFLYDIHNEIPAIGADGYFRTFTDPSMSMTFDTALARAKKHLTGRQYYVFAGCRGVVRKSPAGKIPIYIMDIGYGGGVSAENIIFDQETKAISFVDFAEAQWTLAEEARNIYIGPSRSMEMPLLLSESEKNTLLEIYDGFPPKNICAGVPEEIKSHIHKLRLIQRGLYEIACAPKDRIKDLTEYWQQGTFRLAECMIIQRGLHK